MLGALMGMAGGGAGGGSSASSSAESTLNSKSAFTGGTINMGGNNSNRAAVMSQAIGSCFICIVVVIGAVLWLTKKK